MKFKLPVWSPFGVPRPECWLALLVALALPAPAKAQSSLNEVIEPQMLRLQVTDAYTGIRIEAESEKTKYANSGGTATFDHLFAGPVFGLNSMGSVYHPNLLQFSLNGEISPGYAWDKSNSGGLNDRKEIRLLGNYNANFIFLANKPYRATITVSQNYTYRDYDFFNRVEVNSWRYGANLGYQKGPVPFTITAWRRDEESYGQARNSSVQESGVNFEARNKRESGESSFNYTYTDSTRRDFDIEGADSGHSFGLGDSETFGSRKQIQLSTNIGYGTRSSADNPTDELNASGNLSIEHSPTLSSFYDLNYNRNTSSSSIGSTTSTNYNGSYSLRHQLYESLTSTLRLEGLEFDSDGNFEDFRGVNQSSISKTSRFGGSVTEQYSKRLGSVGRLTLVGSILLEHTTMDNGGDMLVITDERHSFSSDNSAGGTDTFFLSLPDVDVSTIIITDGQNNFPAYQEGIDYTVSKNGSLTLIRRTPNSVIPEKSTVLVDYRALAPGSGEYDTVTGLLNMRIDLWNGLLAVYARYNSIENTGATNLLLQNMHSYTVGAETTWRWIRLGIEFAPYDSNLSSYQNTRLFESFSFRPDAASTLNFDFVQSKTEYLEANRDETYISFMTRYQRGFNRHFGFHMDGGIAVRKGEGVDQTVATIRPELEINVGRLELKVGYNFEYGKYLHSDERQKNMLFISGRRNF